MLHESGLEVLASIPGNADSHRHADDILNPLRQVAGDPNVAADLQLRVELRGFEPLTPSMRTLGAEVVGGRWGGSLVDDGLSEAFTTAWVAVLVRCTALIGLTALQPIARPTHEAWWPC